MPDGDAIRITHEDRTLEGQILLASKNGDSLMIKFDARITTHLGIMPVSRIDKNRYRSILDGTEITIQRHRKVTR